MIEGIERGHESASRPSGGWRAVLAAWALVLVIAGILVDRRRDVT